MSPEKGTTFAAWWMGIRRHEETIRRSAILAVLYLLPALWILQPVIIDPDIWWHLESGKWIVEHGSLPSTDPFSTYGEDKPWVAYSWLFELGMYGLVSLCGEGGIILYSLVGIWLIMLMLHRIIGARCSDFVLVSGLLALSVVALSKMFTPRPWLLTILFFAITLEVVLSLREGRQSRWFWLLPVAYAMWANIHVQFIYGLGLLGLGCLAPLVDRFTDVGTPVRPVMVWGSLQWKRLVYLAALCTLATIATPHHVRLYSIVFELAAQTGMWEYTQEMQAPAFRSAADWAMLGLFAAALVRIGWRRSWSSFEGLLLVVAAASAFRGQRDIWFLVLASLAVLMPHVTLQSKTNRFTLPTGALVMTTLLVGIGLVSILWYREFSGSEIQKNTAKVYPIEAAAFVERQGYGGPLYNHFNWGGYLIWRLPHLKVSMDGRANVHGDSRIKRALSTWGGEPEWKEDPDLDRAALVIANRPYPLTSILRLDSQWRVAYQDETAVVFSRVSHGNGATIALASQHQSPPSLPIDVSSAR